MTVTLDGMSATLDYLDSLGRRGDAVGRRASSEAAAELRQGWLADRLAGGTGVARAVVLKAMRLQKASEQYPAARINFSGAGVLVSEYAYRTRMVDAAHNRAQIVLKWLGGEKLAAGFVNPRGAKRKALSTRNSKTTKNGKTYTYRAGQMTDAMGPSMATAYQTLPDNQVEQQVQARLSARLVLLLDALE